MDILITVPHATRSYIAPHNIDFIALKNAQLLHQLLINSELIIGDIDRLICDENRKVCNPFGFNKKLDNYINNHETFIILDVHSYGSRDDFGENYDFVILDNYYTIFGVKEIFLDDLSNYLNSKRNIKIGYLEGGDNYIVKHVLESTGYRAVGGILEFYEHYECNDELVRDIAKFAKCWHPNVLII